MAPPNQLFTSLNCLLWALLSFPRNTHSTRIPVFLRLDGTTVISLRFGKQRSRRWLTWLLVLKPSYYKPSIWRCDLASFQLYLLSSCSTICLFCDCFFSHWNVFLKFHNLYLLKTEVSIVFYWKGENSKIIILVLICLV